MLIAIAVALTTELLLVTSQTILNLCVT